jgi:hypothetical protein
MCCASINTAMHQEGSNACPRCAKACCPALLRALCPSLLGSTVCAALCTVRCLPPERSLLGAVWQQHAAHGDVTAGLHPHQDAVTQRLQLRDFCMEE